MMAVNDEDIDEEPDMIGNLNIFEEPTGYFQPTKPFSHESFVLADGKEISLQLVGENPLWGHYLWNGAKILAAYLQHHPCSVVENRNMLELGAGAGLPSLVGAILGAEAVVITDYPDQDLIDNLKHNVANCSHLKSTSNIAVTGYLWGDSVDSLISSLHSTLGRTGNSGELRFDTVLLADVLFNHSEHKKLVRTLRLTLARTETAKALVFFTPYRPWLLDKDLAFFDLVRNSHMEDEIEPVTERKLHVLGSKMILQQTLAKVMFENDRGDELMRRTVFGYEIFWADLQQ